MSETNVVSAEGRRRDGAVVAATSITQLAALTGVTPRALRYYEASGVLKATRSRRGTRLFTPQQCEIATTIVLLRKLGLGLDEVRGIVTEPVSDTQKSSDLRALLQRQIADIELRLSQVRKALGLDCPAGLDPAAGILKATSPTGNAAIAHDRRTPNREGPAKHPR